MASHHHMNRLKRALGWCLAETEGGARSAQGVRINLSLNTGGHR